MFRWSALDSGWRAYVPPAVVLLIALLQPVLVSSLHLSPWKGGGFGMFSTIDQPRLRFVRVLVTSEAGTEMLVIADGAAPPGRVRMLADRARALPTDANLAALAKAVADARRQDAAASDPRRQTSPENSAGAGQSVGESIRLPTVVVVEVYRLHYVRASGVVTAQALNQYRWCPP